MASSSSRPHSKRRPTREECFFNQTSQRLDRKTCPICLTSIASSRLAILSPCSHAYCADCIRKWSAVKRTCPLCNSSFNSWLYRVDSRRRTFGRCKLPPLRQQAAVGGEFRRPARNSVFNRGREEPSRSEYSRSRPLPRRRSFRLSASEEPCVVAERVLQWRASIYRQKLRAVPLDSPTSSSRNCSRQRFLGSRGARERIGRVNPWIKRELEAVLADPDPTIIVHVVTSLYASSLEEGTHDSDFLAPLRPFLHEWADMFWHELRCFAESSLTMETYDTVVSYERIR
uniref:RING-type E3 ubiquitin transferase n=1 Tax=Kalanchoe fedtschenkoi TaxID=63787 RepID=A0A7N0UP31_KALFE